MRALEHSATGKMIHKSYVARIMKSGPTRINLGFSHEMILSAKIIGYQLRSRAPSQGIMQGIISECHGIIFRRAYCRTLHSRLDSCDLVPTCARGVSCEDAKNPLSSEDSINDIHECRDNTRSVSPMPPML
jgi:hypothetical protein